MPHGSEKANLARKYVLFKIFVLRCAPRAASSSAETILACAQDHLKLFDCFNFLRFARLLQPLKNFA